MSMPHSGAAWTTQLVAVVGRVRLKLVIVANKSGADFWLWVCDSPTTGATQPTCCPVFVPANSTQSLSLVDTPRLMTSGIYVCATTTADSKTLIDSNDAFFQVAYDEDPASV